MKQTIKGHIVDHFVNLFVRDVVAAVYDLYNNRFCLALHPDDERKLSIAVGFSVRSNLTRNVLFCILALDSILSDDVSADLAVVKLEESVVVKHPRSLLFFVPLVAEYLRISRYLNSGRLTYNAA